MKMTNAAKAAQTRFMAKKRANGEYGSFNTTLRAQEIVEINAALAAANMTKVDFIRKAVKLLKDGSL